MPGQFNRSGKKTCTRCREVKAFEDFSTNNRRPADTAAGRKCVCKRCRAIYMRSYRERPGEREKSAKWNRQWRINSAAVAIYSKAKSRALRTGIAFTITPADLEPLPNVCPVLGFPLVYGATEDEKNRAPSLDRIDNAKGYIPGNVRIISFRANTLKRDATLEELRALVAYCERNTLDDLV